MLICWAGIAGTSSADHIIDVLAIANTSMRSTGVEFAVLRIPGAASRQARPLRDSHGCRYLLGMADVMIRFVRATNPDRPIANATDYERSVDMTLVPQVGDWIQFKNGTHKVESRTWDYTGSAPSCLLKVDVLGEVL